MRTSDAIPYLALLFVACAGTNPSTTGTAPSPEPVSDAARLHDLFEREWQLSLEENPIAATYAGFHDYDDRMPDVSPGAIHEAAKRRALFLEELHQIDPAKLSDQDRVSWRMFESELEETIEHDRLRTYEMPIDTDSGFHSSLTFITRVMPFDSVRGYENYIARLEAMPAYIDQQIENMRSGLKRGFTQPREILGGVEGTIAAHVVDDPAESVFFDPFERFPAVIGTAERNRLTAEGAAAIEEVSAAYERLRRFWTESYVPGARTTLGAGQQPGGEEYYRHQIRHYTTLDLSPGEIHAIGLTEVARIRGEMMEIIRGTGFEGSFDEFLEFLRTDPRFYAKTPEQLLERAAWFAKSMDGKLPSLFRTLPRQPYTVEPVPSHIAETYTAGRYLSAPKDGTRAGTYWVNTSKLDSRPLYTLEALTFHEAVPGHHLQNALADELTGLPEFRRQTYLSAFGEGWALYSEWLGIEAGFYQDPYSNFGRLTYEMWRACRLVVDTGVHAMGWTRQQARDYLAANTALSLHEVSTEIDRYISWPAQALSYKMGELEIRRLRRKAEEMLGERFDVRSFHDAVLLNGSVPLPILADQIDRYIEERLAASD